MKTLILGGVRSGKSRFAESLALKSHLPVTYIATATADDGEMHARIATHRARRHESWTTIEETRALAARLKACAAPDQCLLVDCLTLWLTNLLMTAEEAALARERDALLAILPALPGEIIMVGNETGLGIVPVGALTRRFCDEAGRLHQAIAQACDRVTFMVAGLPLTLKGEPI